MNASPPGTDLRRPRENAILSFVKAMSRVVGAFERGAARARCRMFNEAIRKELESWN